MSITNKAQKDKIINGLLEEIEQIRTPQELEQWQSKLDKNLDIMLKELTRAKKD
jgi:hypothetical protein